MVDEYEVDSVYHLAGPAMVAPSLSSPAEDLHRTTGVSIGIFEALREARRRPVLVYVSSAAIYGDAKTVPWTEDLQPQPRSPYGVAKLATEQYARLYWDLYGLPVCSARSFSIYGPGQQKLVVYDLLMRMRAGEEPLCIAGKSDIERDFVFVDDAASALVQLAVAAPARGEAYNVATGVGTRLDALAATLVGEYMPSTRVEFTDEVRAGDPMRMIGDTARSAALGVACTTTLEEGARETVAWFRGAGDGAYG